MRSLADDWSIVIKKADKGACIVVWYRNDYLGEAEKQLKDKKVYRKVAFKDKTLSQLVDCSNRFFSNLKMKGHITEKDLNTLVMSLRKVVILQSFTCYPKYIKVLKTFLVDQ